MKIYNDRTASVNKKLAKNLGDYFLQKKYADFVLQGSIYRYTTDTVQSHYISRVVDSFAYNDDFMIRHIGQTDWISGFGQIKEAESKIGKKKIMFLFYTQNLNYP